VNINCPSVLTAAFIKYQRIVLIHKNEMCKSMKKLQFCLVAISMLLLALGAVAQVQNGQFTGVVTDPSGAAIPNAKVTVTNMGTSLSVTTTSNQNGVYVVKE